MLWCRPADLKVMLGICRDQRWFDHNQAAVKTPPATEHSPWLQKPREGQRPELRSRHLGVRLELPEGWLEENTNPLEPRDWLALRQIGDAAAQLSLRGRSVAPWFDLDTELLVRADADAPPALAMTIAGHRALVVDRGAEGWEAHLPVGGNLIELKLSPWERQSLGAEQRAALQDVVESFRIERHAPDLEQRANHPRLRYRPWRSLFDGASLDGWKESDFGGGAEVVVEDGRILLDIGEPMTGVTYTGELPFEDYELEVVATRVHGTDFFCGLTFPVGAAHLSFIAGGWGGSLVGVSSLDGKDASENETKQYHRFDAGVPVRFRLRVRAGRLQV